MSATVIISVCTAVCVFAGQRGEGSIVHGMSQTRNVSLPACLACLARLAVGVGWLARRWPHETLRIYSSVVGSMQLNTPYLSPCLHVPPPWEWVVLPARQTPGTLVITTVQPPSTSAAGQYTKRIFRLISPSFSHAPSSVLSIFRLFPLPPTTTYVRTYIDPESHARLSADQSGRAARPMSRRD